MQDEILTILTILSIFPMHIAWQPGSKINC
jgi:hypothetical protein